MQTTHPKPGLPLPAGCFSGVIARLHPQAQRPFWLAAGLVLLGACHASVQADAKVAAGEHDEAPINDFDRPLDASARQAAASAAEESAGEMALLGARHDLSYAGPKSPTCQCLAVSLLDHAEDPALQWELGPPRLNPGAQWVIALSSSGVPCDAPPSGTLGASYQGYVLEDKDVVVYVEALGEGRPMTSGAIIPKPAPGGSVLIEAAGAVYGRPLDGKSKRCRLTPPASAADGANADSRSSVTGTAPSKAEPPSTRPTIKSP